MSYDQFATAEDRAVGGDALLSLLPVELLTVDKAFLVQLLRWAADALENRR